MNLNISAEVRKSNGNARNICIFHLMTAKSSLAYIRYNGAS